MPDRGREGGGDLRWSRPSREFRLCGGRFEDGRAALATAAHFSLLTPTIGDAQLLHVEANVDQCPNGRLGLGVIGESCHRNVSAFHTDASTVCYAMK